ncbi:hypothetical protein Peur_056918 [Populus x canadensis]
MKRAHPHDDALSSAWTTGSRGQFDRHLLVHFPLKYFPICLANLEIKLSRHDKFHKFLLLDYY